jgi:CO/xanthine dehydrogenase Mo-binding subunit
MSKKVNGHAVNLIETRKEQNLQNIRQFQAKGDIQFGAMKNGTIVAASGDWYGCGSGASGLYYGIDKTYTIPNVSWTYQSVYLNAPARGAWRCVADPPGAVIYDTALDKLAVQLGMDPYALRQVNLRAATLPDQDSPNRVWGGNGAPLALSTVYTASQYATKMHAPGAGPIRSDGRLHGIAITGHLDSHGSVSGATRGAIITVTTDGTVLIDMGGGRGAMQPTTMVHIVAETLGMNYADVNVGDWGNTDTALDGGSQGGSGFTGGAGSAFYIAAQDLRAQLFTLAVTKAPLSTATIAGVTRATATATVVNGMVTAVTVTNGGNGYSGVPYVTFSGTGSQAAAVANVVNGVVTAIAVTNGGSGYGATAPTVTITAFSNTDLSAASSSVFLTATPSTSITYKTIMSGSPPMTGRGNGWAASLRSHAVGTVAEGNLCNANGSAASCTELLVDPTTGQVEIIGHWNAVDTGTTVFKHGAQNQIMGGAELQVYQALFAGDVYDPTTGACISDLYTEAQLPTPMDFEQENFTAIDVQSNDAAGPWGAHGIAEPCVTNYGSIICAIYNATGKWVDPGQGPCSPRQVLKALGLA